MDMNIDLKNLNMSDIKDQITKLADKKTLTKIGIIVVPKQLEKKQKRLKKLRSKVLKISLII